MLDARKDEESEPITSTTRSVLEHLLRSDKCTQRLAVDRRSLVFSIVYCPE